MKEICSPTYKPPPFAPKGSKEKVMRKYVPLPRKYMNCIQTLKDAIDTAVTMHIFKNRYDAAETFIFSSYEKKLPISLFKKVDNFNPDRLKDSVVKAYPPHDRPRGNKDIKSVNWHIKHLSDFTQPIVLVKKKDRYILLDGAHRIVAHHIAKKRHISALIVDL